MSDLRTRTIRLASELQPGSAARRQILVALTEKEAATAGWQIMTELLGDDYRGLILARRNLHGATPASTQTADVLAASLEALAKKFKVDRNAQVAVNKLRLLSKSASRWDYEMQRNAIFKIGDLLGVKLPSGMFASDQSAGRTAKSPYTVNQEAMAAEAGNSLSRESDPIKLAAKIVKLKSFKKMVGRSRDMVKDALMALEESKVIRRFDDDLFSDLREEVERLMGWRR